ncbi:MAG: DUF4469 domain-containing protein [Tannerella sp.]|jgi:hypothetical protein|nr:DUF4469 domain-containing protein [Tannerella sp.]
MAKFEWKVWLRPNVLTGDPTDYVAEVDTAGHTRQQADIIERMVAEGSEIKSETIKAILDRTNAIKRDFILRGYGVNDDFIHLTPRVPGSWTGTETYTEGKHRATVDAVLSRDMHEELKQVGVRVLGVADSGARIMLVTDVATGKTDGTLTLGDDIVIAGDKVKIVGLPQPDGSMEPGINVYFVTPDGVAATQAARISENMPSKVVARVPATLAEGIYTLRIVTRFAGGKILKTPRVIEYAVPLVVPKP